MYLNKKIILYSIYITTILLKLFTFNGYIYKGKLGEIQEF